MKIGVKQTFFVANLVLTGYIQSVRMYLDMKRVEWSKTKNESLIKLRGVSFEIISDLISTNKLVDNFKHPNQKKYPNQRIIVVIIDDYYYYVPYVQDEEKIFLKTIIPSRKIKKQHKK